MRRLALLSITILAVWCCESVRADGWLPFFNTEKESNLSYPPSTAASLGISTPMRSASTEPPKTSANTGAPSTRSTAPRQTQSVQHTTGAEETPWYKRSPFSGAHAPKSPFSSNKEPTAPPRNGWVAPKEEPKGFAPWQAVTSGTRSVANGTKAAWHKTVDVLTPGDDSPKKPPTRVAQRDTEPSFLSRMVPGSAPKEPEGPRTVTEWMAQERLKP